MINPDNFIQSTQRKDNVGVVRETSETKPRKAPNARKEFKEVLGKEEEGEQSSSTGVSKTDGDEKKDSLMALAGQTRSKARLTDVEDQKMLLETGAEASPVVQKDSKIKSSKDLEAETAIAGQDEMESLSKKGKFNSEYMEAKPDISFINPNAGMQPNTNEINLFAGAKVEQTKPTLSPIHDIVVELIDKLTIIETKGQVDTVVTLNSPGMFKGAIVVMSQFDTAHGQLNLAFENLTAQAKNLLDSFASRESLLQALSEKGYTVQMITTTTLVEHKPIVTAESAESRFGRDREDREGKPSKDNKEEA